MTREEAIDVYNGLINTKIKEAFEFFAPELRESEDERIRKWLYDYFSNVGASWIHEDCPCEKILAWLEKQKDLYSPADWNDYKDKSIDIWNAYIKGKALGIELGKAVATNHSEDYDLEKQKEQKPTERSEKHIADIFEKVGLAKIAREQGNDELTNALQDAMLELSKMENAEWSEEDEKVINDASCWIGEYANFLQSKNYAKSSQLYSLAERLKSLRPQSKVELSEDVKKILDEVSHILIGLNYKQIAKAYKQAIEKLISLRPHWKPSEEQMAGLECVLGMLNPDKLGQNKVAYDRCIEMLKQLKAL